MSKPIFQRYVQPNATIYNTPQVAQASVTNQLTGSPNLVAPVINPTDTENLMSLHLEFKPDYPKQSPKKGIETGEIILQGRVYYPDDYYGVKSWYKPGAKYYCEVDFLGKGIFYAYEQIESNLVSEAKYFGYPILGCFLRLNGSSLTSKE